MLIFDAGDFLNCAALTFFFFFLANYEFVMHQCSTIYFPSDFVGSQNGIVQGDCSALHNLISEINKFSPLLTVSH